MAIPYAEYPRTDLLIIILVQALFMLIAILLILDFWPKYKKNNVKEVKLLINFLLNLLIGTIIAWFPKFVNYIAWETDWIYGVPLGKGYYFWWTNLSYIFTLSASISIMHFTQSLFKDENLKIRKRFIWATIVFDVWTTYHGIFVYEPGKSSLITIMAVYLMMLNLYSTTYLYRHAKRDIKRLPPSIYRFGYQLIYIGAFLSIIAYFLWALNIVLSIPKWATSLSWIVNTFVLGFFGMGLTLPPWVRKFAKNRLHLPDDEEMQ